jgi:outer membrane protein OmpA-like peptidoglycan-associated protein
MNDHDRDAILARRALFISTALAGLACTTHEPPEQPNPRPEQHAVAPNEVEGDPVQSSDGTRPPWSEIMAAAPPLDVPQGLSKSETDLLTGLESGMRGRYAELEKVWTTLPGCAPSQADCEVWAESVKVIMTAQDNWGALCGYSPEMTNTYLERERAHEAYLGQVGDLLLTDLDAAAKAHTAAADVTAWNNLRASMMGQPHPCLSCRAPTAEPVLERVSFEQGQAALAAHVTLTDEVLERVAEIHKNNRKTRLIVRGHADPSEADPDGLAKRRAEAVAVVLMQHGVRKAELDVRSYGASLLLTRDAAQAEQNRRVDFEVVQR